MIGFVIKWLYEVDLSEWRESRRTGGSTAMMGVPKLSVRKVSTPPPSLRRTRRCVNTTRTVETHSDWLPLLLLLLLLLLSLLLRSALWSLCCPAAAVSVVR